MKKISNPNRRKSLHKFTWSKQRIVTAVGSGLLAILLAINVGLSTEWFSAAALVEFNVPEEPTSIAATKGAYYTGTLDWNFNFENAYDNGASWTLSDGAWYWAEARDYWNTQYQENCDDITSGRYFYVKKQSVTGWKGHEEGTFPSVPDGLQRHFLYNDEEVINAGEVLDKDVTGSTGYALSGEVISGSNYSTDGYSAGVKLNNSQGNRGNGAWSPGEYLCVKPDGGGTRNIGNNYLNFYVMSELHPIC